jgi:hypothetical protein
MSFADAFDAPVELNGVKYPVLSIFDYIPWAQEVHEQEKATKGSIIPADLSPLDRFKILAQLASPPDIDQLAPLVLTPAGALRVVRASLKNAGKAEDEADKIIRGIPPMRLVEHAMKVSGLFRANTPPARPPADAGLPGQSGTPVTLNDAATGDQPSPLSEAPATLGRA